MDFAIRLANPVEVFGEIQITEELQSMMLIETLLGYLKDSWASTY